MQWEETEESKLSKQLVTNPLIHRPGPQQSTEVSDYLVTSEQQVVEQITNHFSKLDQKTAWKRDRVKEVPLCSMNSIS